MRPRLAIVLALAAVLAGLAVAGCGGSSHRYAGLVRKPPPEVGALSLPDAVRGGRPLAFRAQPKGLLLVFFGYTMCPDVCPTTLSDLGVAVRGLKPEEQARIQVAFVSVDPQRDTAPGLRHYIRSFFRDGHALRTDDAKQLAAVAQAFGAAYRVTTSKQGEVDVIHSSFTYAVDASGKLRLQWGFGTTKQAVASDLRALLKHVA